MENLIVTGSPIFLTMYQTEGILANEESAVGITSRGNLGCYLVSHPIVGLLIQKVRFVSTKVAIRFDNTSNMSLLIYTLVIDER